MAEGDYLALTKQLAAVNGRFRLQQSLIWGPRGALLGLLLAAIVAALARLRPLLTNQELGMVALGLAGIGLVVGWLWAWLKRPSLNQQARQADAALGLQERATTAVEIAEGAIATTPFFANQQRQDALAQLKAIDVAAALPLNWNRRDWLLLALAIVLLGMAVWLNNPQAERLATQRAIGQAIAEEANELEALAEEIRQDPNLNEAQQEELLAPIEEALEALQASDTSQEQAVATLSEASTELRELSESVAPPNLQEELAPAAEALAENRDTTELTEAFQDGSLNQASAATAQLAENLPTFNEETLSQLADALAQTSESLETTDQPLSEAFQEAASALDAQDLAAAQEALEELAAELAERGEETAVAEALSQQAQSLADQLNESRQTVAQAGAEGTSEDQQQAAGDPQAGEGATSGGLGGGQAGSEGQTQGEGGTAELESGRGSGLGSAGPRGGDAETVFVPDAVDLSNVEGEDVELPAECRANPADCGGLLNETPSEFEDETSIVPYTDVFGDYQDAANEALSDDYIPLGLKGYVRDYFSSLEP